MTEELKQLREALRRVKYEAVSLADAQVIALEALTAAQPAQEVAAVNTREQTFQNGYRIGYQAGRASLPTQPAAQATPDVPEVCFGNKATPEPVHYIGAHITEGKLHASVMRRDSGGIVTVVATAEMHAGSLHELDCMSKMKPATPEPVGEPDAWLRQAKQGPGVHDPLVILGAARPTGYVAAYRPVAYCDAHPAPGVPEGLPAVLTDWGFDVHDDEDGRTWLTIRNPDDDVARMSVPTVWPLNGNQTIGAVVLHQFSAALTSALAAAHAKGVDPEDLAAAGVMLMGRREHE